MIQTSPLNGFILPLTFGNTRYITHSDSSLSGFQNATPTCMKTWARVGGEEEQVTTGVVVGCEDGTLYVLGQVPPSSSTSAAVSPSVHVGVAQPAPIKTKFVRFSRNSLQNSRSNSPSPSPLSSASHIVLPRAHVVSGVNREQVEAPKNYVDFDDEPDKLKDMLQGKARSNKLTLDNSSEKTVSVTSPTSPNTPAPVIEPSSRRDLSRSRNLLETYISTNSSKSFSAPSSPNYHTTPDGEATQYMDLLFHIVPSSTGNNNTVKSVLLLANASICVFLQESGHLYVVSMSDGQCLARTQAKAGPSREGPVSKDLDSSYDAYVWQNLQIKTTQQATYIVASASNHEAPSASTFDVEDSNQERAFSAVYELIPDLQTPRCSLEFLGYWELDCVANTINILTGFNGQDVVAYISSEGNLSICGLKVLPELPASPSSEPEGNSHLISTHRLISNPFKSKSKSSSSEHLASHENKNNVKILLDEPLPTYPLSLQNAPSGLRLRHQKNESFAIAWTVAEIRLLHIAGENCQLLYQDSIQDIQIIQWLDDFRYAVIFEDKAEIYVLLRVDADNNAVKKGQIDDVQYYPNLEKTVTVDQWDAVAFSSSTELLTVTKTPVGRQIQARIWGDESHSNNILPTIIFNAPPSSSDARITALLPLDVGTIIQGSTDGYLRALSLERMYHSNNTSSEFLKISDRPLNGYITGLHFVINYRTRERYILGGADDGTVAIWTVGGLELCGRWVVFNTALDKVVQFPEEKGGPFYGCVLCVAEDGAIAIVAIDGFQFLYLIPGASADLESICLEGNNLLLIYADRQCRIWDVQTKEFRRSMGVDKIHEFLDHGGWTRVDLAHMDGSQSTVWDVPVRLPQSPDAASTLSLQTERFVTDTVTMAKTISTSRDQTRAILQSLDRLRVILSAILTFGLNPDVDSICKGKLGIINSKISVGFSGSSSISFYNFKESRTVWCISGDVTASRLLGIVLLLKAIALFEEYTEAANSIIMFYTTSLAACVGSRFIPPSLPYLASLWFQGSYELRQAIRIVFDATLFGMSDEEAIATIEHWQHFVPCLQQPSERESLTTALSLFICGYIAAEKYSFVSAPVLRDISKSISLYLLDETSSYRVLAIDLCSRGFNVWQYYIDAMEILRSLFMLATTSRKNDISVQNVGAHARSSVLLIATNNTQLFMSTLGVDILTPPSLEHRRSVLQILAFLIRKRPSVLQPNLPKLMEAVVKSLDPNNTTNREAVLDTATEIIGYVVKTFPNVDFQMLSQRLAVGTHEGAVIMYDLKTAIRLFVLEGHKKAITALNFSPDGRRLVTLSMEESVVLVWKVGTSIVSFFNPGAPPSQGNSGGKPFKTFPFRLSDEGVMSDVEALTKISFEWLGDRSVRMKIRDSILTFSTG